MRKFFSRFLMTAGILLILGAGGLAFYNVWDAHRASAASEAILAQMEEQGLTTEDTGSDGQGTSSAGSDSTADADVPLYELYPDMEMPAVEIDGYRYVGTLEVPSLDLKLPVMEEWDYTRLKISPCLYSGSVYQDNMVIAGHNYARHFSRLKWLKTGTEIYFTDMNGNQFRYTIGWMDTIQPADVEGMTDNTDQDWDMTLFTCTTGGSARCAIRCIREE